MGIFHHALIFTTGFVASFVGANTGGAGLLMTPVLIFLGLPTQEAIATRRLASAGTIPTALWCFWKEGKVNWHIGWRAAISSFVGAYTGSVLLLQVSEDLMQKLLGVFILITTAFVMMNRNFGIHVQKIESLRRKMLGYILFFIVGFTASFFGGGGQIFGTVIMVSCFGLTFLEAAGTRKIASMVFMLTALTIYINAGLVHYAEGITMLVGGTLGAYTGSHYGLAKGDAWLRKLFIGVVLLSGLKLLV